MRRSGRILTANKLMHTHKFLSDLQAALKEIMLVFICSDWKETYLECFLNSFKNHVPASIFKINQISWYFPQY